MKKFVTASNQEIYVEAPASAKAPSDWAQYVEEYQPGRYINVVNQAGSPNAIETGDAVTWYLFGTDEYGEYFESDTYASEDLEDALAAAYDYIESTAA